MDFILGSTADITDHNAAAHNNTTTAPLDQYEHGLSVDDPASALYTDYNISDIFGPKRDPLYVVIPITFIYMAIFITGVVGNISTCVVISKNRSMHTATNYYLFSLAVSDFLLLIAGVPQEMYMIWSKYPYVFGEAFCVMRGMMAEASANATVLTITAFTVERYVAICHPFLSHTMSKLSRAVRLIGIVWVISILMAVPQALQFGVVTMAGQAQCGVTRIIIEHSFELSTFVFFVGPMSLITVLYVLIGLKLRSASLMPRANGATLQRRALQSSSLRQQTSQGTRRVLKMLVAVVVAFFLCWAPFHAQRLVAIYGSGNDHLTVYVVMTYISGILYYLSTCINPLLYNLMSNKFREAFKETLATCCHTAARANDQKRAYRVLSRGQRARTGRLESTDYSVMTGATGFSGSSMRDESLYSTATRKQSVDTSMTAAGGAPSIVVPTHGGSNRSDSSHSGSGGHASRINGGGGGTPSVAHPRVSFDCAGLATAASAASNGCNGHELASSSGGGGVGLSATADHHASVTAVCGHQPVDGCRCQHHHHHNYTADTIHVALLRTSGGIAPEVVATEAAAFATRPTNGGGGGGSLWRRLQFWRWRHAQHPRSKHPMAYYSPPMEHHRLAAMAGNGRKRKMCVEFEETLLEALETVETAPPPPPPPTSDIRGDMLATMTAEAMRPDAGNADGISGSSLTDADTTVLNDELSAYMHELRMRELS